MHLQARHHIPIGLAATHPRPGDRDSQPCVTKMDAWGRRGGRGVPPEHETAKVLGTQRSGRECGRSALMGEGA